MLSGRQAAARPIPDFGVSGFSFCSATFMRDVLLHRCVCLKHEHTSTSAAKLCAPTFPAVSCAGCLPARWLFVFGSVNAMFAYDVCGHSEKDESVAHLFEDSRQ